MSRQGAHSAQAGDRDGPHASRSDDTLPDNSGSQLSERDAALVTLNLARFHDSIEARRADAVQHARSVCNVEHIPSMAVLAAGSLSVRRSCACSVMSMLAFCSTIDREHGLQLKRLSTFLDPVVGRVAAARLLRQCSGHMISTIVIMRHCCDCPGAQRCD